MYNLNRFSLVCAARFSNLREGCVYEIWSVLIVPRTSMWMWDDNDERQNEFYIVSVLYKIYAHTYIYIMLRKWRLYAHSKHSPFYRLSIYLDARFVLSRINRLVVSPPQIIISFQPVTCYDSCAVLIFLCFHNHSLQFPRILFYYICYRCLFFVFV